MESMDLAHGTSMKAIKGMEKGQPWGGPQGVPVGPTQHPSHRIVVHNIGLECIIGMP